MSTLRSAARRAINLLAAFAILSLAWAVAPVEARSEYASLEDAVAAGALDTGVASAVLAGKAVEAVVRYEVADLIGAIGALPTGPSRANAVRDRLGPQLHARKALVVTALGRGARVVRDFAAVGTTLVAFDSPDALLAAVNRPEVAGVRENIVAVPTDAESGPLVQQPAAQADGYIGKGVGVAVLDTGVDFTNAAFGCTSPGQPSTCKVAAARDIAPDDGVRDSGSFHGTNVAGVALSIAPGSRVIGLDVFGSTGTASSTDISAAIDWVIANASTYNIRSINLSLGGGAYAGSCSPDPGFAEAIAAGIVPVVAAGNSGNSAAISWPACVPGAVSVGAVYDANVGGRSYSICSDSSTAADRVTCFSQSSSTLSMLAPGALISAAGITMAGTSQATPHVAGAVAVLAGAAPTAAPGTLSKALIGTGPLIKDARNGLTHRRLDVDAALNQVLGTATSSPSPSPSPTPTPTPDTVAPKVSSRSPAENATGVSTTSAPSATFSEAVTGVSGSTMVLRVKSTGASVTATVSYSATSRTATLKPSAALASGNSYTVTLGSGIKDAAGNALPVTSWTFTTALTSGDTTRPKVSKRSPISGATNVATNTAVTATFSEPVSRVSTTSVVLKSKATGTLVSASVSYDAANRRAILKPGAQLKTSHSYTVTLTNAIRDAAGNRLAAVSWTFTTSATAADVTAPTLTSRSPKPKATGVARTASVTATFSEPVTGLSASTVKFTVASTGLGVGATVTYDGATRKLTIKPSSSLARNTTYRVRLTSGFKDLAGNAFAGTSWTFTTAP